MKIPRINDFDPNAKKNLVLKSSLENMPAIEKPKPAEIAPASEPQPPKTDIPERSNARPPVRPNGKRIITRNSFEIYEDQMDSLRKLSFQDKMNGRIGSMSAMVRDAIDAYLKEHPEE